MSHGRFDVHCSTPCCKGYPAGGSNKCAACQNEPLRAALKEAIELADEGWRYASPYLRKKHDVDADLERLRAVLGSAS